MGNGGSRRTTNWWALVYGGDMTDRYFALTVLLERDIREDDLEAVTDAIQMVKGVLKVEPHVTDIDIWAAESRARHKLATKLWAVLYPDE